MGNAWREELVSFSRLDLYSTVSSFSTEVKFALNKNTAHVFPSPAKNRVACYGTPREYGWQVERICHGQMLA